MKSKWARFAAICVVAGLTFGGSFTCNSKSNNDNTVIVTGK